MGVLIWQVHSMKDVPMHLPEGLTLAVTCEREEPLMPLFRNHYQSFDELPQGAKVGTSSLRHANSRVFKYALI